jgi:NAD(P)-dependent dehydrogenase (short-subunit alcohol dehydrogenase family)
MAEASVRRFRRVDILINNAGVSPDSGMMPENVPHEIFEQTVRVNLLGLWYCCREVGQRMLAECYQVRHHGLLLTEGER